MSLNGLEVLRVRIGDLGDGDSFETSLTGRQGYILEHHGKQGVSVVFPLPPPFADQRKCMHPNVLVIPVV